MTFAGWPFRPCTDAGYDEATDELATLPEPEYRRPSDFPSARAFLDATDRTTVAHSLGATATVPGAPLSSAPGAVATPSDTDREA